MSSRFNAPSRSPLRHGFYKCTKDSSPFKKASKSPLSRSESRARPFITQDLDAECLRAQAEVAEQCHEIAHLTPAFQRFWSVSKLVDTLIVKNQLCVLQNCGRGRNHSRLGPNGSALSFRNQRAPMRPLWQG